MLTFTYVLFYSHTRVLQKQEVRRAKYLQPFYCINLFLLLPKPPLLFPFILKNKSRCSLKNKTSQITAVAQLFPVLHWHLNYFFEIILSNLWAEVLHRKAGSEIQIQERGWMAVNQWPAAGQLSQQQGITAQGQTEKGHKLVISNEILQCSRVLPALGHFTTLSAVRKIQT